MCCSSFAYPFVMNSLHAFVLVVNGHKVELLELDMDANYTVLVDMTGMDIRRTLDKVKN